MKISKLCDPILVESLFDFDQHNSHEFMVTIKPNGLKTPKSTKSGLSHLHIIKEVLETVTCVHQTLKILCFHVPTRHKNEVCQLVCPPKQTLAAADH